MEAEKTLDPEDWDEIRRTFHDAVDLCIASMREVRDRPVWRPLPDAVKTRFCEPAPVQDQPIGDLLTLFEEAILPYTTGNTHPRFWGWVHGGGSVAGVLGEMLAAFMNCNAGGRDHIALYVERQVIDWCKEIFSFPTSGSGILTSGTSMGTLIALTVARNVKAGADIQRLGVAGAPKKLVGYTSREAHSCVVKTFELLGLGQEALRLVPVDAAACMNVEQLAAMIAADRADGFEPIAVIASAGTVNTGAIDDLDRIADLCRDQNLWMHVDGAFGALAILTPEFRERLTAISRADSVAFDFHKWLHVPYDAGCVLLKDEEAHRNSFSARREYLTTLHRGLAGGDPWFCEYGPELSRGFRALKVWFTLKAYGIQRLAEQISQNCRQAGYLGELIGANRELQLLAPIHLNIVCFRYLAAGLSDAELDALNNDIVAELQIRGIAAPSTTRIQGKAAIRVALTNHRTRREDLDLLVAEVCRLGKAEWGRFHAVSKLLCAPIEKILVSGGDTRSTLDAKTGLNRFGCTPFPRPEALSFGSSTASSISKRAFHHVGKERDKLIGLLSNRDLLDEQTERLRNELRLLLGLDETAAEIVFSPSGTDAALHSLFLTRALSGAQPLDCIMPASDETGGGVPYALSGRHFDTITSEGGAVAKGEPIAGLSEGTSLLPIPIRTPQGVVRSAAAIDQEVMETVSRSVAAGRRVLLQVMDSSKLGRRCPSLDCLKAIQSRFDASVQIVVDACQMRISLARLQWHLAQGHLVLISGSKFFTGPPFSGALLVPAALSAQIERVRPIPAGLQDYTNRCAWPLAWPHLRSTLPDRVNFGQHFRWLAALEEMRAYFSIPLEFRRSALQKIAEMATDLIRDRRPDLLMLEAWTPFPDEIDDGEMAVGTIFPFLLRQGRDWMSFEDAVRLYHALNQHITDLPPAALSYRERALALKPAHIGQPVGITMGDGRTIGALRICTSARTVIDLWAREPISLTPACPLASDSGGTHSSASPPFPSPGGTRPLAPNPGGTWQRAPAAPPESGDGGRTGDAWAINLEQERNEIAAILDKIELVLRCPPLAPERAASERAA